MRFYLINKDGAKVIDIENNNKEINKALGWSDAWNTPTIKVCGERYIAICSDLGKIRHEPVSALSSKNLFLRFKTLREPFLVGPIIITKFDGIDDFESLNDEDIEYLESSTINVGIEGADFYKEVLILD